VLKKEIKGQAPVSHACDPSYSGGRDQEDHGLSQSREIIQKTLSQKNPLQKRAGGAAQGVGPELIPAPPP
jgi:hypothetical protein